MKNAIILSLAALAFAAPAFATNPVTISNDDATALFVALDSLKPGLTPHNTGCVAVDLQALKPYAQAHDKALIALQQANYLLTKSTDPKRDELLLAASNSFTKYGSELITIALEPVVISDDEIGPAGVSGKTLAMILQYLTPPKKPEAKK